MKQIIKNNKFNYLKEDGTLLSEEWFDFCDYVVNGYGIVAKDRKWNYIKEDGTLLSKEWFDECSSFSNRYGRVKKDGKYNYLKEDGSLICEEWSNNTPIICNYIWFTHTCIEHTLYSNNNKLFKIKLINNS